MLLQRWLREGEGRGGEESGNEYPGSITSVLCRSSITFADIALLVRCLRHPVCRTGKHEVAVDQLRSWISGVVKVPSISASITVGYRLSTLPIFHSTKPGRNPFS